MFFKFIHFFLFVFFMGFGLLSQAACQDKNSSTDQSILIAIDVSDSIKEEQMDFMLKSYRDAFTNEENESLFMGCGCTEIGILFWSSQDKVVYNSKKIINRTDIIDIANFFEENRHVRTTLYEKYNLGGSTLPNNALRTSHKILTATKNTSYLRTVLISGDGKYTTKFGKKIDLLEYIYLKDLFIQEGVRVYGLPINYDDFNSDKGRAAVNFYRDYIVTNPSFLTVASSFEDVNRALNESFKKMNCLMM